MSQIKLLLDVVSDMRHLADSLAEYASAVTTNEHLACEKPAEAVTPEDFVPIYEPDAEEQPTTTEPNPPTEQDIGELLFTKLKEYSKNHKSEARAFVLKYGEKYGTANFTAIPKSEHPAMLAELEAMM